MGQQLPNQPAESASAPPPAYSAGKFIVRSHHMQSYWRGTVVECRSLAGELLLFCA